MIFVHGREINYFKILEWYSGSCDPWTQRILSHHLRFSMTIIIIIIRKYVLKILFFLIKLIFSNKIYILRQIFNKIYTSS